jgi:hypothetical protein
MFVLRERLYAHPVERPARHYTSTTGENTERDLSMFLKNRMLTIREVANPRQMPRFRP